MPPRKDWFYNTVYWDDRTLVYQVGSVTSVDQIKPKGIGYILHLHKILKRSRTAFYCITNLGTPNGTEMVKLKLPTNLVIRDGQLTEIDLKGCTETTAISYLCTATLNVKEECLRNASMCSTIAKQLLRTDGRSHRLATS